MGCSNSKITEENPLRILVLGAGAVGKSTVIKQIRLLHSTGFGDEERSATKDFVLRQMLLAIAEIVPQGREKKSDGGNLIPPTDKETDINKLNEYLGENETVNEAMLLLEKCLEDIPSAPGSDFDTLKEAKKVLGMLWGIPAMRALYKHSGRKTTSDAALYGDWLSSFFLITDKVLDDKYSFNDEEMLKARRETTSIGYFHFNYKNEAFVCVDVGGQSYVRSTWEAEYRELFALLFVVNLEDYADPLVRGVDGQISNKLLDSISIARTVSTSMDNSNVPMVILLNKSDLFRNRLQKVGLKTTFPDCDSSKETDFDYCTEYIGNCFTKLPRNAKTFYYVTNALDTKLIESVFALLIKAVLDSNMGQAGFNSNAYNKAK